MQTKPTPVREMTRNEFAGTSKRGMNVIESESSVSCKLGWTISSTISLSVPLELAATVVPLPSIIAAKTSAIPSCGREGVEHGPK